jgi:hypothetical protein
MIDETGDIPQLDNPLKEPGIPIDFNTFVLSLSSSAAYHLGLLPHPESGAVCLNLPMARQTLDILSLMMQKTQGNLTPEEQKLIKEVHYSLRTAYIAATAKAECGKD